MMAIAVRPMIRPIRARCSKGSDSAWATGEPGWNKSVPNSPAEIMNRPRPAASIRYSGQWRRNASVGPAVHRANQSARAKGTMPCGCQRRIALSPTSCAGSSQPTIASSKAGTSATSEERAISASGREARVQRHAAVDEDAGAGDVVGLVGGEPGDHPADVLDLANALVGHELHQLGIGLGRVPGGGVDRGADRARAHAVDPDAMRGDLLGDRLHHQHHAALGRGVVDVTGPRDHLVHRADADDLAGGAGDLGPHAAALELLNRLAGAEELAGEVDADHGVPGVERHLLEARVLLQAGVADQDVDRAELIEHRGEHRLALVLLADVGPVGIGVAAFVADLGDHLLGRLALGGVVDHHVGAGPAERQRHALADAGAGAGDERLLPGQRIADLAVWHRHLRQRFIHAIFGHLGSPCRVADGPAVPSSQGSYRCPPTARSRLNAALIRARWVKAWGKLPSASLRLPVSSAYRPTWLAKPSMRSKINRASSSSGRWNRPARVSASTSQKVQMLKVPSSPAKPSGLSTTW